jgi:predicted nucleic acid-binding protein
VFLPSKRLTHAVVARCSERQIFGGAVYDALVGLTAAEAGATLLTRDKRAARAYERLAVVYELM